LGPARLRGEVTPSVWARAFESGGGAVAIDEVVERGTAYSHGTTYVPEAFLLEVRTLTHATNTYQRRQASQERVTSSQ